jgi:hypothetical protein
VNALEKGSAEVIFHDQMWIDVDDGKSTAVLAIINADCHTAISLELWERGTDLATTK